MITREVGVNQSAEPNRSGSAGGARSLAGGARAPAGMPPAAPVRRLIASQSDLAAGLFLVVCALLSWWFGQPLKVGTAYRMGPGYVPILLSWVIGAFGLALAVIGLIHKGPALEKWRVMPIVLLLGSLVAFALTIERTGLLISSALAVTLASLASPQPRLRQIALLAACLAGFACVLFPFALQLPLRILP